MLDSSGSTYLIYALSSITLKATAVSSSSGMIQASGAFSGVLRLVKLVDPRHKDLLDKHYQVYPTAVTLDYTLTDTTGTLIFDWTTAGDGSNLLMLTYPHHRIKLQDPNFPDTSALGYLTTKVSLPFCILSAFTNKSNNRGGCIPPLVANGACCTTSLR